MSEICNLTIQIDAIIPEINQKYNLKLDWYIIRDEFDNNKTMPLTSDHYADYAVTEEQLLEQLPEQIREILVGLSDISGDEEAEALCNRWLDGLRPMFEREPEKVLTELLEVLKKLNK
jgi:uncharacterized protein YifE (UPF0438 family)